MRQKVFLDGRSPGAFNAVCGLPAFGIKPDDRSKFCFFGSCYDSHAASLGDAIYSGSGPIQELLCGTKVPTSPSSPTPNGFSSTATTFMAERPWKGPSDFRQPEFFPAGLCCGLLGCPWQRPAERSCRLAIVGDASPAIIELAAPADFGGRAGESTESRTSPECKNAAHPNRWRGDNPAARQAQAPPTQAAKTPEVSKLEYLPGDR